MLSFNKQTNKKEIYRLLQHELFGRGRQGSGKILIALFLVIALRMTRL